GGTSNPVILAKLFFIISFGLALLSKKKCLSSGVLLADIFHYRGNSLVFDFRFDLTLINKLNLYLKREGMGFSRTFGIQD
ncbi:MAG: hypothetical protein MJA30_26990, partial [Cytophagales bacterium]|nr:hypothetical protein [Cytophagales bacterium]